uniref:Uncharacterized protein n=1 Tax=Anguilla anguilla TaxID=7936 RepID=A0A0E9RQ20_ANGAN
MGIVMYRAGI